MKQKMINSGSFLSIKDNTGAKVVQCIKIFNKSEKKAISLGGLVLVCIKQSILKKNSKIKKSKIQKAILVGAKKKKVRVNGSQLMASENAAILVNTGGIPLASRIFGSVPHEVKLKGLSKLVSAAKLII